MTRAASVGARTSDPAASFRIGEIADTVGVSTRTVRYYEQVGLMAPSSYSTGGSRRYCDADRQRIARIRELQSVMGFNLDEIREILQADDRLAELTTEYRKGVSKTRQKAMVREAARLNRRMQEQTITKMATLETFLEGLRTKAARYAEVAKDLGIEDLEKT
jgi:DNA-binding transcriptional MerR regulator